MKELQKFKNPKNGKAHTCKEWADIIGITPATFRGRVARALHKHGKLVSSVFLPLDYIKSAINPYTGEEHTIKEIAEMAGVTEAAIRFRIRKDRERGTDTVFDFERYESRNKIECTGKTESLKYKGVTAPVTSLPAKKIRRSNIRSIINGWKQREPKIVPDLVALGLKKATIIGIYVN